MSLIEKLFPNRKKNLSQVEDAIYIDTICMGNTIPKVIHQTFSTKLLPPKLQENIENLKLQNPNWIHKLYDDDDIENYIRLNFPKLVKLYLSIDPAYGAARADFFRYLIIYKEGGVYLDIKSGLNRPLDTIIKNEDTLLLSHWTQYHPNFKLGFYKGITNPNGELQQWHIISVKGHPALKSVIITVCNNIEKYNPFLNGTGKMGVLNLTGPVAYTNAVTPLINFYPCRIEPSHEDIGLIYNVLDFHEAHHKVFEKQHYSQINTSIIKQSVLINIPLNLFNSLKKLIKLFKAH